MSNLEQRLDTKNHEPSETFHPQFSGADNKGLVEATKQQSNKENDHNIKNRIYPPITLCGPTDEPVKTTSDAKHTDTPQQRNEDMAAQLKKIMEEYRKWVER